MKTRGFVCASESLCLENKMRNKKGSVSNKVKGKVQEPNTLVPTNTQDTQTHKKPNSQEKGRAITIYLLLGNQITASIYLGHAGGTTNGFRTHGKLPTGYHSHVGEPLHGMSPEISCCYRILLCLLPSQPFLSRSYMNTLRWLPVPHWTVSLALTVIMFFLFQALLLEQINDSLTNLGKNLEIWIVSNDP